jgi:hypothetical protein
MYFIIRKPGREVPLKGDRVGAYTGQYRKQKGGFTNLLFEAGIFRLTSDEIRQVLENANERAVYFISVAAHLELELWLTHQEIDEFAAFKAPQLNPPRIPILTEEVLP